MSYEDRELSGALFRNANKQKESQPDHTGTCKIDGKTYRISAWVKEGKGGRFFSLAFTSKDERSR